MAAERRRVPVGPEEINLLREGYRMHRDNYVRVLEHVKANINVVNAETQGLYRRRNDEQLRRRIREFITREIAE